MGIETDEDALVFHGAKGGDILDLSQVKEDTHVADLRAHLERLYPDMPPQMQSDLLPLVVGNLSHIASVRRLQRPVQDIDHREQVLAIGRGFDWLHKPNWALIVGPYSLDLSKPISVAANLILSNIKEGRVRGEDGVVLMTSGIYRDEAGFRKHLAAAKSRELARLATRVIQEQVPELAQYVTTMVGVTNLRTRQFIVLEDSGLS